MRRKIDVTAGEMLELREQGLSNHDIARNMDISIATVRRTGYRTGVYAGTVRAVYAG